MFHCSVTSTSNFFCGIICFKRFGVAIHFCWSWIVGCNIWLHLSFIIFFLCYFSVELLIWMSAFLLKSFSNWLNELFLSWVCIFCFQSLLSKITKREPWSCTRTVWLFHYLISFYASFSSFDIFSRTPPTTTVSNMPLSMFSINTSKLLMLPSLALYKDVYTGGGGNEISVLLLFYL